MGGVVDNMVMYACCFFMSSPYWWNWMLEMTLRSGETKSENSNGLRTEPWGTNVVTAVICRGLGRPVVRPLAARAKGPGFDYPNAQHVQRFISRACTYGAVGSLVLSWSWADNLGSFPSDAFGFYCVITMGKGCMCTICPSSPSNSFFGVGKLVPAISRGK